MTKVVDSLEDYGTNVLWISTDIKRVAQEDVEDIHVSRAIFIPAGKREARGEQDLPFRELGPDVDSGKLRQCEGKPWSADRHLAL